MCVDVSNAPVSNDYNTIAITMTITNVSVYLSHSDWISILFHIRKLQNARSASYTARHQAVEVFFSFSSMSLGDNCYNSITSMQSLYLRRRRRRRLLGSCAHATAVPNIVCLLSTHTHALNVLNALRRRCIEPAESATHCCCRSFRVC